MALEQNANTSQERQGLIAAGFTYNAQGLRQDLYHGERPLIVEGMVVAEGDDIKTSFDGREGRIEITSANGSRWGYGGIVPEVTGWKRIVTIAVNKLDKGFSWVLGSKNYGEERI